MKPWLALDRLGLDPDPVMGDVLKPEPPGDAFRAVNSPEAAPWLVTGAGQGLGEGNAVWWYLAASSHLMPATRSDRAGTPQWVHLEQARLEPLISPARFFATILPQARESRAADIANWRERTHPGLSRGDSRMADRESVLRSGCSIVDIAVSGYVHVIDQAGIDRADHPMTARRVDRASHAPGLRPLCEPGRRPEHFA